MSTIYTNKLPIWLLHTYSDSTLHEKLRVKSIIYFNRNKQFILKPSTKHQNRIRFKKKSLKFLFFFVTSDIVFTLIFTNYTCREICSVKD